MTIRHFWTLPLILLCACGQSETDRARLASAYADLVVYHQAQRSPQGSHEDSLLYARGVDSVLQVHDLTRETFSEAFSSLGSTPASYEPFFESVQVRLRSKVDSTK